MKKPTIRLWLFERKFFFAGEELKGLARLSPIRIIDIVKPIHIRLKGVITATSPDDAATFERECLRMSVYADADTGYEKRPDVYYYDFNFQLPYSLPPTINNPIVDTTIAYTLKVELEIQHGLRTTETLQSEMDINIRKVIHVHDPQYLIPISRSCESSARGCCLFASGRYSVDASIEKTGFTPDDPVIVSVRFKNETSKKAKPYMMLIQRARNPYCLDFEEQEFPLTVNSDYQNATLPARSEEAWDNLIVRIPTDITESFSFPVEQPFFKVLYFIELGLSGSFGKAGARLPIEIGTAPFHRSSACAIASPRMSGTDSLNNRASVRALAASAAQRAPDTWSTHSRDNVSKAPSTIYRKVDRKPKSQTFKSDDSASDF